MKKIYLWWQNTRKYILLDIFLLFAMTVAIYSLSNALGAYRMLTLEQELLNNALENEKSGYFKPVTIIGLADDDEQEEMLNYNKEWYEDIKTLRNTESVEAVHCKYDFSVYIFQDTESNKKTFINVNIFDKKSTDLFPKLYEGEWPETPFDSEGNLNAVVYGDYANDLEIGDLFPVNVKSGGTINLRICGKIYNSYPYPAYTGGGSEANAEMIYNNDGFHAFVYECDETMEYVWISDSPKRFSLGDSFIIEFSEDADDEKVEAVLNQLAKKGGVSYIKDISARSKEMSDSLFKSRMTVPIFYTVISFCAFVCITILYIIKRTKELAVYHLLGYSKQQMTVSIVLRIVFIISFAAIINVIYIENYYNILAKGIIQTDFRPPYFDEFSTVLIIGICAIMLIFALIAALCTLHSRAPIDMQRASKE